mgnify:CR=1 FL=1
MSTKRNVRYKCPFCDKRFTRQDLVRHIEDNHMDVLPSSFVVKLPKISLNNVTIQNNSKGDMDIIIKYIEKNGSITRINAQALINKEKTTTSTILNKLVENGVLVKIGNGPSTRYEINK